MRTVPTKQGGFAPATARPAPRMPAAATAAPSAERAQKHWATTARPPSQPRTTAQTAANPAPAWAQRPEAGNTPHNPACLPRLVLRYWSTRIGPARPQSVRAHSLTHTGPPPSDLCTHHARTGWCGAPFAVASSGGSKDDGEGSGGSGGSSGGVIAAVVICVLLCLGCVAFFVARCMQEEHVSMVRTQPATHTH